MAKKKPEPDLNEDLFGEKKLTGAQYWKWRNTITEMWLAEHKLKAAEIELKFRAKEVELLQAKMQVFVEATVKVRKSEADEAKSEYFNLKRELEKELAITLDGKVIDDVTFEIRELEEELKKPASELNQ